MDSATESSGEKRSKLIKIKSLNTVKLDQDNFAAWEAHVKTMLRGYDLLPYVESSFIPLDDMGVRQEHLLLGWIFSSLSADILSQAVLYETSAKVWEALHQIYASTSGLRILLLRQEFHTTRKGDSTISDYLAKMKRMMNALRSTVMQILDSEFTLTVLAGLESDFDPIVVALLYKSAPSLFQRCATC